MKALDWLKQLIVNIVKFFIKILSCIVDALEDKPQIKGTVLKSLMISINDDGLIFLKSVNGIPLEKYRRNTRPTETDDKNDPTQANIAMRALSAPQPLGGCFVCARSVDGIIVYDIVPPDHVCDDILI